MEVIIPVRSVEHKHSVDDGSTQIASSADGKASREDRKTNGSGGSIQVEEKEAFPSPVSQDLEISHTYGTHDTAGINSNHQSHTIPEIRRAASIDSLSSISTRHDFTSNGFLTVPGLRTRQNSVESFASYQHRTLKTDPEDQPHEPHEPREESRIKIMQRLDKDEVVAVTGLPSGKTPDQVRAEIKVYTESTLEQRIITLAEEIQTGRRFEFERFERLCIINILNAQQALIRMDEELSYPDKTDVRDMGKRNNDLQLGLERYRWAIEAFHFFSNFKQPGLKSSRLAGRAFAVKLREPRYWDSPEALNLIDLTPAKQLESVDRLRGFLQRKLPLSWLDAAGKEQREVDIISRSTSITKGSEAIRKYYQMHARHTSPIVDRMARLAMSTLGGTLLLVPMTVLAIINSLKWALIATCLFVLFFGVVLALVSKVSNDQILVATAAYGAVMVVFVANTLPLTIQNTPG